MPDLLGDVPQKKVAQKRIEYTKEFMEFYEPYPRKSAKADAMKAFLQMGLQEDEGIRRAVIADVLKRNRQRGWPRNRKMIPLPASFLRGQRWEDDWQSDQNFSDDGKHERQLEPPRSDAPVLPDMSLWHALSNTLYLRYMMATMDKGRIKPDDQAMLRARNEMIKHMTPSFDEEISKAMTEEKAEVERECRKIFVNALLARFNEITGLRIGRT